MTPKTGMPHGRKRGSDRVQPRRFGQDLYADVAQLVAHHLAKVRVAGSSPVVRSQFHKRRVCGAFLLYREKKLGPP